MRWERRHWNRAVDGAAAAVFAGAVAFAASALASGALAALLAPIAVLSAYAGLTWLQGIWRYPLAPFELVAIDPPEHSTERPEFDDKVVRLFEPRASAIACAAAVGAEPGPDAAQALSDALADLKRSLR